ncbi:hypothetical protein ANCDUO_15269 [Ancylostoma duodenale]|uniref:Uncharacterized protein n=1 Tax=Ancylostoma duodenale TaxID=51022 RepID=A0A0C2G6N5_9BILA|nr:hypothetical protein ANCDUO_15269 [Ancylostoma duodenale]
MDPELWSVSDSPQSETFFTVYVNFLASRGPLSDEQKKAWALLDEVFDEECQSHLKELGLPHC